MPICQYLIIAKTAIRDMETNNISLINILEQINASAFPLFLPEAHIVGVFIKEEGDDKEIGCELVVSVGAVQLMSTTIDLDFTNSNSCRIIMHINALPIPGPGEMKVKLNHGDNLIGTYTVNVLQRERKAEVLKDPSADEVVLEED